MPRFESPKPKRKHANFDSELSFLVDIFSCVATISQAKAQPKTRDTSEEDHRVYSLWFQLLANKLDKHPVLEGECFKYEVDGTTWQLLQQMADSDH